MFNLTSHFRSFSSNCLRTLVNPNWNVSSRSPSMGFHCSPNLCAEPLRKKKRIDPQVLRERAEKRIKRIQRDIRRLEKVSRQLKPIAELEMPKKVLRDSERVRKPEVLTDAEMLERVELKHMWAIYKRTQHVAEMEALQRIVSAQEKALDALEEASPELYQEALQFDFTLIPFKMSGPVETPPIEKFEYPEGEYHDITKVYQPIIPSDPKMQRKLGLHKKK